MDYFQQLARLGGWLHPSRRTLSSTVSNLFGFFPQGATSWQDVFTRYHCDLDPAAGPFVDFDGSNFTYDGHRGHDSLLRSFDEQTIGVPVFAAMDGTVIDAADGNFDRNLTRGTRPVNFVLISHGDGLTTLYLHLKQGSVAVSPGQVVKAGQQIGKTGSSGDSDWPHLHFQCMQDGEWFEPSAGPMRSGPSNWLHQVPIDLAFRVTDADLCPSLPNGWLPPVEHPRAGTYVIGTRQVLAVTELRNVPALSTWRRIVRDPNGNVRQDSGTVAFNNPILNRYRSFASGGNALNLNVVGDWTVDIRINGVTQVVLPFRVVATAAGVVNRPPSAITAVTEPITPDLDLPVFCRVQGDLIFDDPDYNVVRYRYVWRVDGEVVRDVTTAGRADCIPHGTLLCGHKVTCSVTPSDGMLDGPTAMATLREAPGSVRVITGTAQEGGVGELRFLEGKVLSIKSTTGPAGAITPIRTVIQGQCHSPTVGHLEFRATTYGTDSGMVQTTALFDYSADGWVTVDSRSAPTSPTTVSVAIATDPARFVAPDGTLKARIVYRRSGHARASWTASLDEVQWLVKA